MAKELRNRIYGYLINVSNTEIVLGAPRVQCSLQCVLTSLAVDSKASSFLKPVEFRSNYQDGFGPTIANKVLEGWSQEKVSRSPMRKLSTPFARLCADLSALPA